MKNSIVVIGSCMIDFVCYTDRLPKAGETVKGTKFATNFGGKGANQCVAARKLGGSTLMIARVGDDLWGDKYITNFDELGIDRKFVKKTKDFSNGIAQISVSGSGENQIIIVPGANLELNVNDVEEARQEIENSFVIVCQLETPVEVAMKAIEMCKGISILNGAPGQSAYDPKLITEPTIFCVNETEAELFSGLPVKSIGDAEIAIKQFLGKGCKTVIITLGSMGAVLASKEEPIPQHVSSPTVTAIDTTGAGDAFIGALAFILANYKQLTMKEAVKASCYVAAKSCEKPGTQISYPDSSILKEYFKGKCLCIK